MRDELDQVLGAVGPRLRALRKRNQTTLAELSATTGISVSTLSRLESGQRRPSLELLLPLAKAHKVPLDEMVGAPATGDPRIHGRPITRHGMSILPLTRRPGGIQAYKQVIPASRTHQEPNPQVHVPHWFGPVGSEPVEFLSLFGRQGERMHVSARPIER